MKSFSDNIMDSQSNFDDSDYYPPWESTNDETEVPYSTRCKSCEEVLASFAASSKDKITERRYFVSERWGIILRAQAVTENKGWQDTTFITCWSKTDPNVEIAVAVGGSRH